MGIGYEKVAEALETLSKHLPVEGNEGDVSKAESDLDQPEGADIGWPADAKKKMSDEAKSKAMKAKVKKAEDEEDEDEDEDEEMEKMEMNKKYKKSFSDELPEEVQTKIEVSDFLRSLVEHTGESIEDLRLTIAKGDRLHGERYETLEKSVEELHANQAKIGVVLKAICEKIGVIENAPAAPAKAETIVKSADRTFKSGLETEQGEESLFKGLSNNPMIAKSQISTAIIDLVKKGDTEVTDLDLINFETSGFISPAVQGKLKNVFNG